MPPDLSSTYALAGTVSMAMLALLYLLVWRAQPRRWCSSCALAYVLATLVYAGEPHTLPTGDSPNLLAVSVGLAALVLLADGMLDFFGIPPRAARGLRGMAVALAVGTWAALVAGSLSRLAAQTVLSAYFVRPEQLPHAAVSAT